MSDYWVKRARFWYRLGAWINVLCTVPAFVAYNSYISRFFDAHRHPNYPFLVWIWSGMAFLWGISFFEVKRDPVRAYPLLKYTWLEKCVTSASVITAFVIGDIPGRILVGAVFTDVIWIPLFVRVHRGLARDLRAGRIREAHAHVEG